ncbi:hypothetical protein ACFY8O_27815 [Streptomyces argenteolus]|uniref:Uncharacterized protein n=1 Tax=Streptomyces argenteolus TaxID=67274 RepID=A0ABW6XDC3_9ACTN
MNGQPRKESQRDPVEEIDKIHETVRDRATQLEALTQRFTELSRKHGELDARTASLSGTVRSVGARTDSLESRLDEVRSDLDRVTGDVAGLLEQYARDQAVLTARFELSRVTEEWRETFGGRRRIRDLARRLVRRVTPESVRQGSIDTADIDRSVREHLLQDPGFWLAHAMIAVSARLAGNDEFERVAARQAQELAPGRTPLFLALVAAKSGDHARAGDRMDEYLREADPDRLGGDFLAVLDATAAMELGERARTHVRAALERWAADAAGLHAASGAGGGRWRARLEGLPTPPGDAYAPFDRACAQWSELRRGLQLADVTQATLAHLRKEFPPRAAEPEATGHRTPYAEAAVDRLIDHMDPDEAAMHAAMGRWNHYIAHDADEEAARREHDRLLDADADVMDVATLLDHAVFRPSLIALGDDARRLVLGTVLDDIRTTAEELAQRSSRLRPRTVTVAIEGWSAELPAALAVPVDARGLADELTAELRTRAETEAGAVRPRQPRRIGGVTGGAAALVLALFLLDGALVWLGMVLGSAAVVWGLLDIARVPAERRRALAAGTARSARAQQELGLVLDRRIRFFADWDSRLALRAALRDWSPDSR